VIMSTLTVFKGGDLRRGLNSSIFHIRADNRWLLQERCCNSQRGRNLGWIRHGEKIRVQLQDD
ncbi:hypothetical protein NQZ68_007589, partial [Dissostichus eleginoides]